MMAPNVLGSQANEMERDSGGKKRRWFLSTDSIGVKRLSLSAGSFSAIYELVYCYEHPPAFDWTWYTTTILLCGFYFLCAWLPVRVVAWIIYGFVSDARKDSN